MKNKFQKVFKSILCVILTLAMLSTITVNVLAEAEESKVEYLKDVRLIYADSVKDAKTKVPEGYKMLEDDLNKGAGTDDKVFFVYSTTTNPEEAITDIKMMNMYGGFVVSDYEEQIKNVQQNVKDLASDVKVAVATFVANYEKGTYGAMAAYRALSAFTVDEADGKPLADYFIYDAPEDDFYIKLVLSAHQNVISSILSALSMAVQGGVGDTWLDRLAKIEDPEDCYDSTYWDDSEILWEHFQGFYNIYKTIDHTLYDNGNDKINIPGKKEDDPPTDISEQPEAAPEVSTNGIEVLYEIAYRTLEQYSFKTGQKFSKWFLDKSVFEDEYFESFYCMLEVMTPAELSMMRLCGPLYMILSTGMDASSYNDYITRLNAVVGEGSVCSVWAGVNTDLFRSSIGITDKAARSIAETEFEQGLNNEGDDKMDTALKTAGLIACCGAISLGVGLIVGKISGAILSTCINSAIMYAATAATAKFAVIGTIFGSLASAAGVTAIVVALVIAIIFLVNWIIEYYKEHHPTYTEIPEFMYDYVNDGAGNAQFVLYEGVKFQDGKIADVNLWAGREWHAMYVSHDKAAGAPIEADVVIRYNDGGVPDGYAGLAAFGYTYPENMNKYDFDDDDGVFVTYRQEDLTGDYARGEYLHDVKLFSDEDADKCKLAVLNERYVLYEMNLTPDSDYVTYLGYKTTNDSTRALTDIRVAYDHNTTQYAAGGGDYTYGASGSTGDGTLTLYVTTIGLFGTPIRSNFMIRNDRNAPAGYEPVNLFSGGPAVSFNLKDDTDVAKTPYYLYFLPSVTYTSGTEYLGGVSFIYDQAAKYSDNGPGSVAKANEQLGYTILHTSTGKNDLEGCFAYTTTYNPYRAIYKITASKESDTMGRSFSKTIYYDGVGYSLVDRYIVTSGGQLGYETYTDTSNDRRLYTAGIYNGGEPMLASDLYITKSSDDYVEGFIPVSARLSENSEAVDLARGFFRSFPNSHAGGQPTSFSFKSFFLFVRDEAYKEGSHLTNLYIVSKEQILGDADVDCSALDNSYIMDSLAAQGAHTVIEKNLNIADSDNATYLAYTKMHKDNMPDGNIVLPMTDLILYYAGDTDQEPSDTIKKNGIVYHLVSDANLLCKENNVNSKCKRVYLYYTTNPAAGSPIIDIKIDNTPIINGWQTVRTQNDKALSSDMDSYYDSMWFIHMKRITEDPKYIGEVVVGIGGNEAKAKAELVNAGCDYIVEKDLNNNVGAHSDYIYLGYKRTSDPNQAIRDLRTTHDNEVDSFVKNGVTYYKIEGNLNAYTHLFADDIFLYYTKDAKAGTPIISLGTSQHVANWTHGEGNRYVVTTVLNQYDEGSDLNDNCGYQSDYIYLLITRDRQDAKGIASMIGNGSVVIVVAFVLISAVAIAWICIAQKKRRNRVAVEVENAPETDTENDELL